MSEQELLLEYFKDFILIGASNSSVKEAFTAYCFANDCIFEKHPELPNTEQLVNMIMHDAESFSKQNAGCKESSAEF